MKIERSVRQNSTGTSKMLAFNMSGNSAAKVLLQIEKSSLKKKRETISKSKEELFNKIKERYDSQVSPYYAASRLWAECHHRTHRIPENGSRWASGAQTMRPLREI